jgi:hypothetical protein
MTKSYLLLETLSRATFQFSADSHKNENLVNKKTKFSLNTGLSSTTSIFI